MGLHKEIRASRLVGRSLQHGLSLTELQEELCVVYSILPLSLDPLTTMEELYRWANKYSTLEDNIRVTTQTVMITIKPA